MSVWSFSHIILSKEQTKHFFMRERQVTKTTVHLGLFIYLFIMKFVQLGTQIKTRCEKKKIYKKIHKKYIMKYIKTIS